MGARIQLVAGLLLLVASVARGELKLPGMFSDHAVLQADIEVPIWGWADAGQHVEVTFGEKTFTASADAKGKWLLRMPAQHASATPIVMTIKAGDESRTMN